MDVEFLTIREAAQRLKVSERTVRRWIHRGYLRAMKVGRTIRIREADLVSPANTQSNLISKDRKVDELLSISSLSDEVFAETWDNEEDAVYDRWRGIYGIREG